MSETDPLIFHLATPADTDRLAQLIAPHLGARDIVLLSGQIGAGKTHFCRALIQSLLGRAEDVPSPSFTLVQTYHGDFEIWHADLYRLSHPDEVEELGLQQAFGAALCLIEWPDRLGSLAPKNAISLQFSPENAGRVAVLDPGHRPDLRAALTGFAAALGQRKHQIDRFLQHCDWTHARRDFLAGDASARRYERLQRGDDTAVLMDAPPDLGERPADFVRIAAHLRGIGLSAPRIMAQDLDHGLLLIEDFGDGVFARLIEADPALEAPLYTAATDALVQVQSHPAAIDLPNLNATDWAEAAAFALTWYRYAITGDRGPTQDFVATLTDLLQRHADGPRVMILRDYHAENLLWLPDRQGVERVGLLDFDLAQLGQPAYDLVSLLQDARRDVAPETERAMIARFQATQTNPPADFAASYAVVGAQRALRILGIFARLCLVGGKPRYLDMIPRVWTHLGRNLAHPALAGLARICADLLPPPSAANLERIRVQCGHFR